MTAALNVESRPWSLSVAAILAMAVFGGEFSTTVRRCWGGRSISGALSLTSPTLICTMHVAECPRPLDDEAFFSSLTVTRKVYEGSVSLSNATTVKIVPLSLIL